MWLPGRPSARTEQLCTPQLAANSGISCHCCRLALVWAPSGGTMKGRVNWASLWLLFALLRAGPTSAQSGWYLQPPWPAGEFLASVSTPDPSTIVAVGERGRIVRSTDGGETWTRQDSGTSNVLLGVSFVDADT